MHGQDRHNSKWRAMTTNTFGSKTTEDWVSEEILCLEIYFYPFLDEVNNFQTKTPFTHSVFLFAFNCWSVYTYQTDIFHCCGAIFFQCFTLSSFSHFAFCTLSHQNYGQKQI